MNYIELDKFIRSLQATTSRLKKEEILSEATEEQKRVLQFLFNPYIVTGISKKKLPDSIRPLKTGSGVSLDNLLTYLSKHSTGTLKDVDYVREVAGESGGYEFLVYSIARKDISLGVCGTTFNKVYGKGFIPSFSVQLASKYYSDPDKNVPEGSSFAITEKFDGVRCVLIFEYVDGEGYRPKFFTRAGKRIYDLVQLEQDARFLNPSFVYDGELLLDAQGDSNVIYRKTMSVVGSDSIKKGVVFNVFDCVLYDSFKEGWDNTKYIDRRQRLLSSGIDRCSYIRTVPWLYSGNDKSKIEELLAWAKENHKEGVMINLIDASYICARTTGLLKVKTFNECEAIVRSIETGTGKNSNRLGAVIVEIKDSLGKFHKVRVGSGFTDEQRDYYFKHQKKLLGKVVEISYFEVTHNQTDDSLSLRFPTWLDRVRDEKSEEDMNSI